MDRGITLVSSVYQNSPCTCQQNTLRYTELSYFCVSIPELSATQVSSPAQFLLQQSKAAFPKGSARENTQCAGVQRGSITCSALAKKWQLSSTTAHSKASTPNSRFSTLLGFSSSTGFPWIKCGHIHNDVSVKLAKAQDVWASFMLLCWVYTGSGRSNSISPGSKCEL